MAAAGREALPRGTVTFLFTDMEGSTRILRHTGADYAELLAVQRQHVRAACTAHGGHEVDTQGDAFMFVFARADSALEAAAELQRRMRGEPWPEGTDVRVRVGLHTGEPQLTDEGYVGIDVVRAARICAAAHGGQVLASRTTYELAGKHALRDLGEHRLKDLGRPERLFQLLAPGLAEDFPPPRSLNATNLPAALTTLLGRERELARAAALLARGTRLLTLTGAGGAGKTRLAVQVAAEAADDFDDGVLLVPLGALADADLVVPAVAQALGVRERPGRELLDEVEDALRDRRLLLVLDNFEHVAGAASALSRLLAASPRLVVVATSRVPLRIEGEKTLDVRPLAEAAAVALFAERAHALREHFAVTRENVLVVRDICRRVDCLPLAVELAAARTTILSPQELLERLELALLETGRADAPERQRTLRATIDWSYRLLTPEQRLLHEALAVFAGGCTLAAAEAVCGGPQLLDDLAALVEGSLLRRDDDGREQRFVMLETVREYARTRLGDDGRRTELHERHARYFVALAEEAEQALEGAEQARWLERLDAELANLRLALDWALNEGRAEIVLRLASALGRFWRARGHVREARAWLGAALALDGEVAPEIRAKGLWTAARQAAAQSDLAAAGPLAEQARDLFRGLGNHQELVYSLCELASISAATGDLDRAGELADEALDVARALGDVRATSAALHTLGGVAIARSDHARARALYTECFALRRELGDPLLLANSAYNLGVAAFGEGDLEAAAAAFGDALDIARELGDVIHTAGALCCLGEVALERLDLELAQQLLEEGLALYRELGSERDAAECLLALGGVAAASDRPVDAARLWGAAEALRGDAPLLRAERVFVTRYLERVRRELGTDAFAQARKAGKNEGAGVPILATATTEE